MEDVCFSYAVLDCCIPTSMSSEKDLLKIEVVIIRLVFDNRYLTMDALLLWFELLYFHGGRKSSRQRRNSSAIIQ